MLFYDVFFRKFGVRKDQQLLAPPLPEIKLLELPRKSVLHYLPGSSVVVGPASDHFLFRNISKPILMQHITELGDSKGNPRPVTRSIEGDIRKYHLANRRFRQMRSLDAARDDTALVVYNYGMLAHTVTYTRSLYAEYFKWWNTQASMWKNAGKLSVGLDRQHYLLASLPKTLPSVNELNQASGEMSQTSLSKFNSAESLFLLELWKWFGPQRQESVLHMAGAAGQVNWDRINLVFQESGRWFVVNLGLLSSWRKATKEELAANPQANKKGIEPIALQKRFLRLMMSLMQVRTVAAAEVTAAANQGKDQAPASTDVAVTAQDESATSKDSRQGVVAVQTQTKMVNGELVEDTTPNDTAATLVHDAERDQQIEADLAELEALTQKSQAPDSTTPMVDIQEAITLEGGVMKVCDRLAESGVLSAAEYRRYDTLAKTYQSLTAPDGKSTLADFIRIAPEQVQIKESPAIPDIATVLDKTMLKSSLHVFDSRYVKEVLDRDVAGMVMNLQHAGIAVTDYQVEEVEDILGAYKNVTVRVVPVEGASSTFHFRLPAVQEDGTYQANGIKYRMRKQRGDLPIRKIAPDRVALTSYYGKVFVSRSSKRVNDYGQWLRNHVMAMGLNEDDATVTNLQPADVFDNTFPAPRLYSILAMGFRGFNIGNYALSFDHTKREMLFGKEALARFEKDGAIIVGHTADDLYLIMDSEGTFYSAKEKSTSLVVMGTIEELLKLELAKAPVDFAELRVLSKRIPIGMVLGYELGLSKLLRLLQVKVRRVPAGTRVNLEDREYALVFSDETLVLPREDRRAALVLAGFNEFHRSLRQYSVYDFDQRGVYLNVLESNNISVRYLREVDMLYQLFIDPITRELLIEMKEPTDFRGLLLRSCDLLLTDQHPDELDPAAMRIKGYERVAGAVYTELVRSIRIHNGRAGKAKLPIDLNPYAVWKAISQDPAVALVSDINPIENLKQIEAVTYNGAGGRNSRSMTKHTRIYHENDMGTISESTVDSSDVAINTYTSADPQFTSLRGISRRYKVGETGATALLSTSALLSPGADRDDPKRVNFIGIQHSHGIACAGYRQSSVRTGYEQVIAHRTSDLFALSAKKAGKVISVSDTSIVVEYDDGEQKGYELGRRFGNAAGMVIPHSVVTQMKPGQKFKEGEMICFNQDYFEPDLLNPKGLVWKAGVMVKTVLLESSTTLEDSSAISPRVAKLLTTKITKMKTIVVNFDQSVKRLVKAGDEVESEDILCIIEDAVTANSDLFDEASLDTLRVLSAQTPQAKVKGVIERVEAFYHGDKEDMSETLRAIASASDRDLIKRNKAMQKPAFTGSVDEGFRVDGEPLALDTMAIRVYITTDVPAGVGDKGVFCNQMKTVFGEVLAGDIVTESGKTVDAVFGSKSVADRIVLSPDIIGTTATLLDVIGKKALAAYRS